MEGRTRRLLRHSRSQQRTAPKPLTDIIELGRLIARGYRNPTNYQLRMLLIAGGLDASTHTQLRRAGFGAQLCSLPLSIVVPIVFGQSVVVGLVP